MKRLWIAFLLVVAGQFARGEAFLFLQGIDGDSTNAAHKGWIDVQDFAIGAGNPGTRAHFFSLSVGKPVDSSSPRLSLQTASGVPIPSAKIEMLRFIGGRSMRYYTLTFSNLVVVSVSQSGHEAAATERVDFDYTWLSWSYIEFDASGRTTGLPITYWWDVARSAGGYAGVFRVTATRSGTNVVVSWPGETGKKYNILSSGRVNGPYTLARSVTNSYIGTYSSSFPIGPNTLFFSVERQ